MNIFNRVIIVILTILFLILSLIAIINTIFPFVDVEELLKRFVDYYNSISKFILFIFWIIFFLILFVVLILELIRRKPKTVKLVNVREGKATMTLSSIEKQVHNDVMNVSNVQSAKIKVLPKRSGVITNLELGVEPGLDLAEKTREIVDVVKDSVSMLGVKLYGTKVNFTPVSIAKIKKEIPEKRVEEKIKIEDTSTQK
jgi:hypothetical protein